MAAGTCADCHRAPAARRCPRCDAPVCGGCAVLRAFGGCHACEAEWHRRRFRRAPVIALAALGAFAVVGVATVALSVAALNTVAELWLPFDLVLAAPIAAGALAAHGVRHGWLRSRYLGELRRAAAAREARLATRAAPAALARARVVRIPASPSARSTGRG